jgi:hypothetical protein
MNSKKQYPVIPNGQHNAILVDIADLGMLPTQYGLRHRVRFVWVVPESRCSETGRFYEVSRQVSISMHPDSSMYTIVSRILGNIPSDDKPVDLESLIGKSNLLVTNTIKLPDGRTVANIKEIHRPVRVFHSIPPFIRQKDKAKVRSDKYKKATQSVAA